MLRNYLTVARRNLRRRLGFSVLNVIGLAAGLACVILIGLWVEDELSYDDFHPNAERTYRVLREFNLPELNTTIGYTPAALAPTLRANYPQVETVVRTRTQEQTVERDSRKHVEPNVLYADAGFFEILGFEVQRGTARLNEPGTVLLTPALAQKYFPNSEPVGQTLRVNDQEMTVTGIVPPPPSNTHLKYSLVASLATRSPSPDEWGVNNWRTYVWLQPGVSERNFEMKFEEVVRSHLSKDLLKKGGSELPEDFHLQPITGIHLGLGAPDSVGAKGNLTYVYLFGALAVFVLLLACINFMNLSTARASERANEVGVRRAMGAGRGQLAGQFLGEALIMTGLGLGLALGICALALPAFNDLAGTSIARAALVSGPHLGAYAGLLLVVGVVAGSYPAVALSGYQPVETLRARSTSSQGSSRLRQGLVVFQFAISIALIAATGVVNQQVGYLQSKGLGFDDDRLLVVHDETASLGGRLDAFEQELASRAGVEQVTSGSSLPGTLFWNSMWALDRPDAKRRNVNYSAVGPDYVETLGIEMAAGRSFSRDRPADTAAVLLNEAAAREYGFSSPEEAVGEAIQGRSGEQLEIIGVTENFHYESLHKEIYPLLLFHESSWPSRYVAARVAPGQTASVVEAGRRTWAEFSALPFEYSFLADDLATQYEAERRMETLFVAFAGLAILIACLGLFGLAAYAAQQRMKEIGLRKALGATVTQIVGLLSREFLALVGIAFVVATPVAYVGMQRWLQDFAYRIEIGAGVFVLAGILAAFVAGLSVSYQAWSAAQTDPASVLRSE